MKAGNALCISSGEGGGVTSIVTCLQSINKIVAVIGLGFVAGDLAEKAELLSGAQTASGGSRAGWQSRHE